MTTKTTIPNVQGLPEATAVRNISFVGLVPVVKYVQNPNYGYGICTGTYPEPSNKFYDYGTSVNVRINNYTAPPPPDPTPIPEPTPIPPTPITPTPTPVQPTPTPTPIPPPPPPPSFTPTPPPSFTPIVPAPAPAPRPSYPPPAIPNNPSSSIPVYSRPPGIKQPTPDLIIFDESSIDPGLLVDPFFQEFGGTELINISRADLIDGQQVSYSPIINLSNIRQSFNPNNIIDMAAVQENQTKYGIDLLSRNVYAPYFDENDNLIIEIDQIKENESIEVQIISNGTIDMVEL